MTEQDELQTLRARVAALEQQGTDAKLAALQSALDKKERGNRIWAFVASQLLISVFIWGNHRIGAIEDAHPEHGLVTPLLSVSSREATSMAAMAPGSMWVTDNKQGASTATHIDPGSLLFSGADGRNAEIEFADGKLVTRVYDRDGNAIREHEL